jgi:hypothetical protein
MCKEQGLKARSKNSTAVRKQLQTVRMLCTYSPAIKVGAASSGSTQLNVLAAVM